MKKSLVLNLLIPAVALLFGLSVLVYTHAPAQAKSSVTTYRHEVHITNDADSSTCGGSWATDAFDKTYTVTSNHLNIIQVSFDGSFVTKAGDSPNACGVTSTPNGNTVGAGVKGHLSGEYTVSVVGGKFNPNARCGSTKTSCDTTDHFVATFYGKAAIGTVTTFEFDYTTSSNGAWHNASKDEGGNTGDITGLANQDNH